MHPSSRYNTDRARAMVDGRDATRMVVRSWLKSPRFLRTCSSVVGSRAEVVSSNNNSSHPMASALANASRWRWPPLRLTPRSPNSASSPTPISLTNSAAQATSSAFHRVSESVSAPSERLYRNDSEKRNASWNTKPTLEVPITIDPERMGINPAITCSKVLLPEPVAPTMARVSPCFTRRFTSETTSSEP